VAGTPLSYTLLAVGAISAAMTFFYSIRYIYITFLAPKSDYIHELEHHGHHPHEAPKTMWVPIAILVGLVCVVGLLGLIGFFVPSFSPELFIEHQFHEMLHHMGIPLETHPLEFSTTLTAWGTSAAMLLIGGVLGWLFYLSRKVDSWAFVSGNPILKPIHTFLFNRWYMNSTYYAIFVYGLIDFARAMFATLESLFFDKISGFVSGAAVAFGKALSVFQDKVYDPLLNRGIPYVFVEGSRVLFKDLETEVVDEGLNVGVPAAMTGLHNRVKKLQTGVLSYNIIYMVIIFLALIIGFMYMQYGGM
jgi:NADH:ubiquinone oxidoreductase subunit 5 (subunit L)/multisubunit Na+/H+ antiporter MnhA subunit